MIITPAFLQSRPVLLGPTPDPFAPLLLSKNGETEELGPEVRNALAELRPVLPDLAPAAEGSRRMGRLVTSVIFIEAGKLSLQVNVHSMHGEDARSQIAKPSLPLI
jgi:hypothetical protein